MKFQPGIKSRSNLNIPVTILLLMVLFIALLSSCVTKVKDNRIQLSTEYGIMTPYTSFLVLERDADYRRWGIERKMERLR